MTTIEKYEDMFIGDNLQLFRPQKVKSKLADDFYTFDIYYVINQILTDAYPCAEAKGQV